MISVAFAGCSGSSEEPLNLALSHAESSEQSRVTIDEAPNRDIQYSGLTIVVEGKAYQFGELASWLDRRYQVDGKQDASAAVEAGDVITIPAVGTVTIAFMHDGASIASFEANIPDNKAPMAPTLQEPADQASGVSRMPTFKWASVSDVSGVRYHVEYSIDPTLSSPALASVAADLTVPIYDVPAGKELTSGVTYYWHAQAEDGAGNLSPWSQTNSFTVA